MHLCLIVKSDKQGNNCPKKKALKVEGTLMEKMIYLIKKFERLFQTFKIENKVKELELMAGDALRGQQVLIMTPVFDESRRLIYLEDEALYYQRRNDADFLMNYIVYKLSAKSVSMIYRFDRIRKFKHFDCIIFLHEFVEFEKNEILEKFTAFNPKLKYFELY